ncbi:DUF1648 domain-containing protein [Armatimonas rosea]|uniref:Putative membrane protein n=1 Tax=Armatimonas rosea TaxID=685828 RepID=A0A7W9SRT8_ARMRO|nr:DUF1648 domain-containing protein [Armatimonas rosea]MBB6051083.1 putative membrane protein [Armatimonas rosea]
MQQQQQEKRPLSWAQKTLLVLPALAAAHCAYYYSALPEKMASHFGPSGQADGWMSKTSFMIFYLALVSIFSLMWIGIGAILKKTPNDMINLPNKEYWLAPERWEQTIARLGHQMSVFGIATGAFLMAVMHSCFLANLSGGNQLGGLFFVYFIGFMLFTGIWTVQMLRESRLPEAP